MSPGQNQRALLVIDVQNEYANGSLPIEFPDRAVALDNIGHAMDAARAAAIPVVVVQQIAPADAPLFARGSEGAALHTVVTSRPYDLHIEKHLPSALTGTKLGNWLRERGIGTLTVIGFMTQNCDDSTIRQAVHEGWNVEFLHDASGAVSYKNSAGYASAEEIHRVFSVVLQSRFAATMTTRAWLELIRQGGMPERDSIYQSSRRARKE